MTYLATIRALKMPTPMTRELVKEDSTGGVNAKSGDEINELNEKGPTVGALQLWQDPRPELAEDHPPWSRLLWRSYRLDSANPEGLFGALHGFRCGGAKLERRAQGGRRLRPRLGSDYEWATQEEWEKDRERYLEPHRIALTRLLTEVDV